MRRSRQSTLEHSLRLAVAVRAILRAPEPDLGSTSPMSASQLVRRLWDEVPGLSSRCRNCGWGGMYVCSFGGLLTDGCKSACCENCSSLAVFRIRAWASSQRQSRPSWRRRAGRWRHTSSDLRTTSSRPRESRKVDSREEPE